MDCHISHCILLHFTQTSEIVRGVTVVALVTRFIAAKRGEETFLKHSLLPHRHIAWKCIGLDCLHCLSFICILFDCFVIFCIYAVNQSFEFSLKWPRYKTVANRLNAKPSKKRRKAAPGAVRSKESIAMGRVELEIPINNSPPLWPRNQNLLCIITFTIIITVTKPQHQDPPVYN